MKFIRIKQPVLTRITPHQGNQNVLRPVQARPHVEPAEGASGGDKQAGVKARRARKGASNPQQAAGGYGDQPA